MVHVSKLRPSNPGAKVVRPGGNGSAAGKRPRVYRNTYTRAGRRFVAAGWVVKLQHRGERRTVSLRAGTKAAAAFEAKAVSEILLTQGWEGVDRAYGSPGRAPAPPAVDHEFWRNRLLVRRYGFPASSSSERALSARIDHAGNGYWFPLGTTDIEAAAAKAGRIYETVVERGWEECARSFSRELIVGFEWCSNPILWTYATIHTMVEEPRGGARPGAADRRVLIVEEDAGIRRALEWSVNQQGCIQGAACDSAESFVRTFEVCKPCLVLLNRKLAERLGFGSPGRIAVIRDNVPALTYSLAADGDQLFVSTPGGAEGYLLKRVKPDDLLQPILQSGPGFPDLAAEELLPRVKAYFKELLQPRSGAPDSRIGRLTRRESEVLGLLSKGCVDKEIAQALGISAWTVHGHIKNIFERLRVRTRTEAVVRYLEK